MSASKEYSEEFQQRAVRMVLDSRQEGADHSEAVSRSLISWTCP
jgi:transposase-like protein